VTGDDATLTAAIQHRVNGDDIAILENTDLAGDGGTSTICRRALFGTL
jgi:hypothetical protein